MENSYFKVIYRFQLESPALDSSNRIRAWDPSMGTSSVLLTIPTNVLGIVGNKLYYTITMTLPGRNGNVQGLWSYDGVSNSTVSFIDPNTNGGVWSSLTIFNNQVRSRCRSIDLLRSALLDDLPLLTSSFLIVTAHPMVSSLPWSLLKLLGPTRFPRFE